MCPINFEREAGAVRYVLSGASGAAPVLWTDDNFSGEDDTNKLFLQSSSPKLNSDIYILFEGCMWIWIDSFINLKGKKIKQTSWPEINHFGNDTDES